MENPPSICVFFPTSQVDDSWNLVHHSDPNHFSPKKFRVFDSNQSIFSQKLRLQPLLHRLFNLQWISVFFFKFGRILKTDSCHFSAVFLYVPRDSLAFSIGPDHRRCFVSWPLPLQATGLENIWVSPWGFSGKPCNSAALLPLVDTKTIRNITDF